MIHQKLVSCETNTYRRPLETRRSRPRIPVKVAPTYFRAQPQPFPPTSVESVHNRRATEGSKIQAFHGKDAGPEQVFLIPDH